MQSNKHNGKATVTQMAFVCIYRSLKHFNPGHLFKTNYSRPLNTHSWLTGIPAWHRSAFILLLTSDTLPGTVNLPFSSFGGCNIFQNVKAIGFTSPQGTHSTPNTKFAISAECFYRLMICQEDRSQNCLEWCSCLGVAIWLLSIEISEKQSDLVLRDTSD